MKQKVFYNATKTLKCVLSRYTIKGEKVYSVAYWGEYGSDVNAIKAQEVADFYKLSDATHSLSRFLSIRNYQQ